MPGVPHHAVIRHGLVWSIIVMPIQIARITPVREHNYHAAALQMFQNSCPGLRAGDGWWMWWKCLSVNVSVTCWTTSLICCVWCTCSQCHWGGQMCWTWCPERSGFLLQAGPCVSWPGHSQHSQSTLPDATDTHPVRSKSELLWKSCKVECGVTFSDALFYSGLESAHYPPNRIFFFPLTSNFS